MAEPQEWETRAEELVRKIDEAIAAGEAARRVWKRDLLDEHEAIADAVFGWALGWMR